MRAKLMYYILYNLQLAVVLNANTILTIKSIKQFSFSYILVYKLGKYFIVVSK